MAVTTVEGIGSTVTKIHPVQVWIKCRNIYYGSISQSVLTWRINLIDFDLSKIQTSIINVQVHTELLVFSYIHRNELQRPMDHSVVSVHQEL